MVHARQKGFKRLTTWIFTSGGVLLLRNLPVQRATEVAQPRRRRRFPSRLHMRICSSLCDSHT